jgi:predicted NBD/HSP70 family sugar kinase
MGLIIVDIINITDPEKVVIGGPYVNDVLLSAIKETVWENDARHIHEEMEVVKSELGNNALIMGAATLVLENFFLNPKILEEDQMHSRGDASSHNMEEVMLIEH